MNHRLTAVVMGEMIGRALGEAGITQAEFCRRVACSPKHLNKVINGTAVASMAQLDYWAFALDCRWRMALEPLDGDP